MTLARQQWLFFGIALAMSLTLTVNLVRNQQQVAAALVDLTNSQALVRTVVRMRNVAIELAAYRTERQQTQWRAGMREFESTIRLLPIGFTEEGTLIRAIMTNVEDADQLFQRLIQGVPLQPARSVDNVIPGRIAGALHIVLGDVSLMALQLSEIQASEVLAARRNVLRTTMLLVVSVLGIIVAYMVVFRKLVLIPINRLQAATDRIAHGDLEHRVGLSEKTEIGELGRRFDHMAEQMQASRTRMTAANKELEAFAYSVSHDLRAPLRGMDGFSRILLEQYGPEMAEDAQHCLQMIRDNAVQMGRLIDDLLAFSRLSQQPLRKEYVDQDVLVRGVLKELLAGVGERKITLDIGELPAEEADPRLLKQVWVNLIGNALKYTRSRDEAVIRIHSEIRNGVPVYTIADNGVGFDTRYAQKLFGVFQRLHRAEDYEGTGVGLAIVQRIIHRHGGRIWAEAEVNKGATFHFTLQQGHDK
ncbi:MAG TPA: ATP-binding protein [Burkholderiales bacterium]|nr:ATP-binding protein [Burkholderiales bacterium]